MPYIISTVREEFAEPLADLYEIVFRRGLSNGELNFLITCLGQLYLKKHGTSYNTISDVVKAMECAKLEFYARVARPYEDSAKDRNGDVY